MEDYCKEMEVVITRTYVVFLEIGFELKVEFLEILKVDFLLCSKFCFDFSTVA